MLNTEVKKGKGIDDVVRGIAPGRVEDERLIEVVGESQLVELLEKFGKYLDFMFVRRGRDNTNPFEIMEILVGLDYTLTPLQLDGFLQSTFMYENHNAYVDYTGLFIDYLLHKSIKAGHREFTFNTNSLPAMNLFCSGFNGSKQQPISGSEQEPILLNINGDVGRNSCQYTHHVSATVSGSVGFEFAAWSSDSNYTIHGKGECSGGGRHTHNSTFTLNAEDLSDFGEDSVNCTFRTSNRRTAEELIKSVSRRRQYLTTGGGLSGNKIIFMHPDGTEEMVANYAE